MTRAGSKDNLILIGMPGAGKSVIGKRLAERLGCTFLDLDDVIQSGEQKTLRELIEQFGFDQFLEIEADYSRNLECGATVVATGGSVVYRPDAMEAFAALGRILYLSVPLPELEQRLSDLRQRGVVIAEGRTVRDLYTERTPLYEQYADITVETGSLGVNEVVDEILQKLGPFAT